MEKIKKIFNFDNIGEKIKNFTKWYCWITILLTWIFSGIYFISLISDGLEKLCWIPILTAAVGPFAVWISSWTMYAFGEFVEDIHAMRNKEGTTSEVETKRFAEAIAKQKAKQEEEEREMKRQAAEEQLSVSDVEEAASAFLKQRVSVSDIACTLIYVIPQSTGNPKEMHLEMSVGDQEFTSLDLFFDQNRKAYFYKGRHLALDGAWRFEEEIFGFDVKLFKSFDVEVDEDD